MSKIMKRATLIVKQKSICDRILDMCLDMYKRFEFNVWFIQGGRSFLTAGSPRNPIKSSHEARHNPWIQLHTLRCHERSKRCCVHISFLQVAKILFHVFLHQVSWVETEIEINYSVQVHEKSIKGGDRF